MYQALYRKWRSRTFDQVVGQGHVTQTLKRQVESGRLSHAYLFHGRVAFAAAQAKPDPAARALRFCFRSAPSSPMRLPSRFG